MHKNLLTLQEASIWASSYLKREISISNISYLIQYGKIKKHSENSSPLIDINELEYYYQSYTGKREISWKKRLGDDLNWSLSFDHLREKDTTKHVHRLHPYKGKFIPQLVNYFIDDHIDDYKKDIYFRKDDIILDPFAGSGTTLIQANEQGIHSVGIDISQFNCMISEVKLLDYDLTTLGNDIKHILKALASFEINKNILKFEQDLHKELRIFNNNYFPSPEYKRKVYQGKIDEKCYSIQKEKCFLETYKKLVKKYNIKVKQKIKASFLDTWYIQNVRDEIDFVFEKIKQIKSKKNKKLLAVILSRTIRSCRATTHSDLATLKTPQLTTYYCWKHKKICKPLFSIKYWFTRYVNDTLKRLQEFQALRTNALHLVISSDSRTVDIEKEIKKKHPSLSNIYKHKKIKGIFTSPPYVGQIDYHEQHAYAYDLFNFERNDDLEIGPLYKGNGLEAKKSYIEGISKVLLNCKKYLSNDFDIFLVANDKHGLYHDIAKRSNLVIVNKYKRPVLNRTERDKSPYSEIIFHLKEKVYGTK